MKKDSFNKKLNIKFTFENTVFLLISCLVWAYIWLRAIYVPVLSDEVATFFMYIQTGRFFPPDMAWDANNHILNSAFARLSYLLFGPEIISLRLPNVLFVPLYFYFIFKTGKLIKNPIARWAFYLPLLFTHFLIEFFGYSRGYGMSLALLAGSIWYLIKTNQKPTIRDTFKCLLFTVFAVSANLNLLQTALIIFGLLFLIPLFNQKKLTTKKSLIMVFLTLIVGGLSTWFFIDYSFHLLDQGRLYTGSGDGFWKNTILRLSALVYNPFEIFFAIYLTIFTILSFIIYLLSFRRNWRYIFNLSPDFIFLVLVIGNVIAALLLQFLLNVNFQEDRTAMHYLPLFMGLIGFMTDSIIQQKKKKLAVLLLIPVFILPLFSFGKLSLIQSSYDRMPYVPKRFYDELSITVQTNTCPPVVAGIHKRTQVWSYYNYLSGGKMNPILFSDDPVLNADYLMYNFENREMPNHLFHEIGYDENSGLCLLKRKYASNKSLLVEKELENTPLSLSDEYMKILQIPVDTLICDGMMVTFNFEIESLSIPFEGVIVCELRDSEGNRDEYEAIDLDQLQGSWNKDANKIYHSLLFNPIHGKHSSFLIYFWNKRKVEFQIIKGKTNIYLYSDNE